MWVSVLAVKPFVLAQPRWSALAFSSCARASFFESRWMGTVALCARLAKNFEISTT